MSELFGTFVLTLSGLFFLFTTWRGAAEPVAFAARLGLGVANAGGVNEIRAQYAGFFFAAAVVCGAALVGFVARPSALLAVAMIFGGLIAGRLASLAVDRSVAGYGATIRALLVIDAVGFALAIAALTL
jgi:Domain of unknown function (DUF4345)